MIAHQSATYEQAVTEYSRRYGRHPPPNFEHWFAYAKAVSSPIIDDYDVLDDAISPLLRSSGAEIRKTMDHELEWQDLHERNAWQELVVDQCRGSEHPQRSHPDLVSLSNEHKVFGLVQDNFNALALCDHLEWEHAHGFWESAASLKVARAPLPVLSAAVISTMNDIPFPARAYTHSAYAYDEAEVVEYEKKSHGLYWAGKTTGGFQQVTATDWVPLHRQRFVSLANDQDAEAQTFLRREKDDGLWKLASGPLNKTMFNVHFTDVVQCATDACDVQRKYFDVIKAEPRKKALEYTLVFDADGNGHSARYYRFVQSRSLPLKQTIFREWHDDRLQPWLHYVPISLEMTELPEVVRYFVEEEEGRALAKELALAGREWAQKSMRPEDQVVYLYRLLLELARVQDPERPASK
ncbi:glycosyltransferase family 90 protein [Cercospora zeae-maydis SCOH1-5]|uniref:Glycosyltransferase family 90 protein n=1 Tax=Cercospora zeae-maydis SCOH1-5 TaxID=717836 RepID=A0A6A6FRE5_9PEZI|nr:glycosyltransferase family 90 protein [Cercospora zeae-maydis SCOH1-5]